MKLKTKEEHERGRGEKIRAEKRRKEDGDIYRNEVITGYSTESTVTVQVRADREEKIMIQGREPS